MRRRDLLGGAALLAPGVGWAQPSGSLGVQAQPGPSGVGGLLGPGTLPGPSLDLNFINGLPIDSRIAYTGSGGTFFNAAGVLVAAAANVPRIDFDPVTHSCRGLLIEESRTNLLLNSAAIGSTYWALPSSGSALVVTANSSAGLDGTMTASKVAIPAVSGAGNYGFVAEAFTGTAAVYTISVWLRGNAGGEQVWLMLLSAAGVYYRLSVLLTTAWQRFSLVTGTLTAGSNTFFQIGTDLRDGSQAATPAQTIYAWGAQAERGSQVSSYIPTAGSSATRSADLGQIPVGAWFVQGVGTATSDFAIPSPLSNNAVVLELDGGTPSNWIGIYSNGTQFVPQVLTGGTVSYNPGGGAAPASGSISKAAMAWSTANVAWALNGSVVDSSTPTAGIPPLTTIKFGVYPNSALFWANGYIRRLRYWPRPLSNSELQGATT